MIMRYGRDEVIKEQTLYFTPGMNTIIEEVDQCRDLGIQLENLGKFEIHIENICKKSPQNYRMDSPLVF